jgi:Enolase C-terminal domain-like
MAGGEILFGLSRFAPLIRRRAVDTMPDVKHCGGLLELTRIAAMAADEGVMVAPHNPGGPVSTAASVQACAGMKNVNYLELLYGERAGGLTCWARPSDSSTVPFKYQTDPALASHCGKTSFALAHFRCERSEQAPSALIAEVEHRPPMGDLPGTQQHAGQAFPKWRGGCCHRLLAYILATLPIPFRTKGLEADDVGSGHLHPPRP